MDRENDHDYAASRLTEDSDSDLDVIVALRLRRRSRPIVSSQVALLNNSDHDYVSSAVSSNSRPQIRQIEEDDERSVSTTATDTATVSSMVSASISETISMESNDIDDITEVSSDSNIDNQTNGSDVEIIEEIADNDPVEITNEIAPFSPSPPKKRKRLLVDSKAKDSPSKKLDKTLTAEDDGEGSTCAICLDAWEISGEHRLASLKCGHLFGDSCIRRWLKQSVSQMGSRACPQCKTKAHPREIRYLYAKRLRAMDRSEEHRLREQLTKEQTRSHSLELQVATVTLRCKQVSEKLRVLEADYERLQTLVRNGDNRKLEPLQGEPKSYKLYLERNIDISREAGCRVMVFAKELSKLIVSQKNGSGLFSGYGIRFIDVETHKPTIYLHASTKLLRDVSLSSDEHMLAVTSMEARAKLFDLRTKQITATFTPSDKPLWSCALDRNQRENLLYLGAQQGNTFVYDVRFPDTVVREYASKNDKSPVINVVPVPSNKHFLNGGFLVCTLNSVWFYEYAEGTVIPTRLNIEGPFTYMEFNVIQETLLVTTRKRTLCPQGRYFIGKLEKVDGCVLFNVMMIFFGSKTTPVMVRSTQIPVESNTLIGAYLLDSKTLTLFDVNREHRKQTLPVQDVVYDMCPVYTKNNTYLAALTENKCRLYKLWND